MAPCLSSCFICLFHQNVLCARGTVVDTDSKDKGPDAQMHSDNNGVLKKLRVTGFFPSLKWTTSTLDNEVIPWLWALIVSLYKPVRTETFIRKPSLQSHLIEENIKQDTSSKTPSGSLTFLTLQSNSKGVPKQPVSNGLFSHVTRPDPWLCYQILGELLKHQGPRLRNRDSTYITGWLRGSNETTWQFYYLS